MRRHDVFGMERPEYTGGTMLPRVHVPGMVPSPPLSELSTLRVPRIPRVITAYSQPLDYSDGVPPIPPPEQEATLMTVSRPSKHHSRATLIVDPTRNDAALYRQALFRNPSIGFQRILFIFLKYPALVLVFVSSWTLWGRGHEQWRIGNEAPANVTAFVTGLFILASVVLVSADHNYSYYRAKILSNLRHMCSIIASCSAVAVVILSASTVKPIKDFRRGLTSTTEAAPPVVTHYPEFSPTDRINNEAILIGAACLIIFLSIFTLIFGCAGLFNMEKRLDEEKRRRRNTIGIDNPSMQF